MLTVLLILPDFLVILLGFLLMKFFHDGVFGEKTKATCKIVSEKTNANTRGAQIVQAILYCYGYNTQLFNEAFNADCTAALKAYQSDHGLTADGAAGRMFFETSLK